MRNYSANLYRKFKTRALNTLNGDEFYEYFMRVVESGARFYGQKNNVLIKVVDEKWVNAIESCLDPLERIITKPRRFIRREENVVPIELARRIDSDSVKHLATHTQYISRVLPDGSVIPSKILNITSEESFDIYENRFLMTLLRRISQFLDKRYDALFNETGDEFSSVLKVDSTFNDNDEKVEYNLLLKLHQGQGYVDEGNNDPQIFQRIETIRTMISGFKRSEFCRALEGTPSIRPPVAKTNLIMKEPNFRKCLELWRFLETYNEVGYSIEVREYDGEFDDQYLEELNMLTLFNYLIMKNHLSHERNKPVDVVNFRKKKVLKPKFIHNIIENFVLDYDVPEVEIRQIFNEEITKAYARKQGNEDDIKAAIERALSIETEKLNKEDEREKEREEREREQAVEKERLQKQKQREKEQRLKEKQKQTELLKKQKEKERLQKQKEAQREKERLARQKQKEKEKLLKQKQMERERLQKQKQAEAERLKKQREKEKQQRLKEAAASKVGAKPKSRPKKPASKPPEQTGGNGPDN